MTMSRRSRLSLGTAFVALTALALGGSVANAGGPCHAVEGFYVEHVVSGPDCASPIGLCIAGTYSGDVRGPFEGRASALITTADTATTGVNLFTTDSTIQARVAGRSGTLIIKNAGGFSASGDGPIVDLQTIVGGTARLTGAHGALRAQGTFSFASGGTSRYVGSVCLP